ncbi:MAG: sigma 54-dependent transcriptional regulator, partial [Desulfobacteraceae bacterium]
GHVKGAFTGAQTNRSGLLKAADNGVLLLDEIGELGLDEQAMLLKALEEGVFLPVGSDREIHSRFLLICGTNQDLFQLVLQGRFREDLLARINIWTFVLPGLRERPEDIEPNLAYELDRFEEVNQRHITFNKEARAHFLAFAVSDQALWKANFRDLNAALTRMATLAPKGRITLNMVQEEIERLKHSWSGLDKSTPKIKNQAVLGLLGPENAETLDPFDQAQLTYVLEVCKKSRSLSDAGRKLFTSSREQKTKTNDADRLRKYLARFGLDWNRVAAMNE